jgi:mannose-6-phosphate isomerase-like protein (cupin superfamily)
VNTDLIPYALGPEDGEAFSGFGSLWTVKASAEQIGGRFALIDELAPGGAGTPLHRHAEDETFYVLEGELTFFLEDDEPITATAGSFVHVLGGAVHAFRVDPETARYLIITPQHERFYRAAFGDPAQSRNLPPEGPPDMERIEAAMQEYNVEALGVLIGDIGQSHEGRLVGAGGVGSVVVVVVQPAFECATALGL